MQYCWLTTLFFLSAVPRPLANFTTPLLLWEDMRIRHTWNAVPTNWESLGHPPAGTTINLYIVLKSDRESALTDALYEVSDPKRPRYGKHLSREQIVELVKPHPETLELVRAWLFHHGIPPSSISPTYGGGWLTVSDVLVLQANQLLDASYQIYQHGKTNEIIIRTVGYSLPEVLHTHIKAVAPTTYFSSTQETRMRQTPRRRTLEEVAGQANATSGKLVTVPSNRNGDSEVTPSYLHWLYNTFEYTPAAMDRNAIGIMGMLEQYPSQGDLTKFMTDYCNDAEDATFTVVQLNNGGYDERKPDAEANLGVQYATAITYPTPIFFYSLGGDQKWSPTGKSIPISGDPYLEWFGYLFREPKVPQTISITYVSYEKKLPQEYAEALCGLFTILGLQGVSVLCSSGDLGVGPKNCDDGFGNIRFVPEFPQSCPSVTSVGGTIGNPEVAAPFSGGGFSSYFSRPDYQAIEVPKFLENLGGEHAGFYNPVGRGYPDISAQSFKFAIIVNGVEIDASGTSCSTPAVAGIISLLNDYLISTGRSPLGFLNLWLYGEGRRGFNDVETGSNPGCDTTGFSAFPGWDPVTGLGTPDLEELLTILKKRVPGTAILPTPAKQPSNR